MRKIRPYFVQITQNKALVERTYRKHKQNANENANTHVSVWMFYLCREKNKTLFWANKALFYRFKRNANRNIKKTASSRNFWNVGNMRFVCVFEAVYVCVCAGQSKTGSIIIIMAASSQIGNIDQSTRSFFLIQSIM